MADPVTSGTSPVKSGKETIYTATKVTGPNGNPPKYTTEIIKYDSADGSNPRTIAKTDEDGKMEFTDNASDEDKKAADNIRKASRDQVTSIADDVTTNAEQKEALNKASNNTNKAIDNLKETEKFYNEAKADAADPEPGTREDKFGFHIFPESLRTDERGGQDFLKIDMMKYEPRGLKQSSGLSLKELGFKDRDMDRKSIGSVVLPIPGGIRDNQQVSWSSDNMTALQLAASDIALSTITGGGQGFADSAGNAVDRAGANISSIKEALAANIAGAAAGANRLLTRQTGAIMNPNMELLFDSPQMRTFSFSFLLAPRSQKESQTIIKIIRFFKQGMAPIRSKSRLFLRSPHTFRLAYKHRAKASKEISESKATPNTDHKFLNKFKECAMNGFGVDYTPNGQYSTYEDGVMTAYQVTMNFQEISPIYNDDYGNKDEFTNLEKLSIGF